MTQLLNKLKLDKIKDIYNMFNTYIGAILKKQNVGIDIGSHSIKLVELEDKKGSLELTKCHISLVKDNDTRLALSEILSVAGLSSKRVNVSLSGPSVVMRYLEMPPMKKEEVKSAVKFEGEKYIPFKINESIIDCAMIDKTASGSQRVLLVVAKKKVVDNLLELFKEFNLEIKAIDIDSFAVLNSFERLGMEMKEDATYGLINIGARFSNMNIVTKNNVYFTRDIPWGGMSINERIRDAMGMSLEGAEALKQNPGEKKDELESITSSVLDKLTAQIRMSFDYFESQFGKNVEKLYISGGSAYLFNIAEYLKYSLGIDIVMWNSLDGIRISEGVTEKKIETEPALFAVAVGLALRK